MACVRSRVVIGGAAAALLFLGISVSGAAAAPTYTYHGESFGPDGTQSSTFQIPGPVGIDSQSGAIYVGDTEAGAIKKFNAHHQPEDFSALGTNELPASLPAPGESQIAVSPTSHAIYVTSANAVVAYKADGEPAEFPALGSSEITGFSELCGVAVDPNGDIYAGDYAAGQIDVYAPNGELLTRISGGFNCNIAVDGKGNVYASYVSSPFVKLVPSSFPVTAATIYSGPTTVDSGEVRSVSVNQASNEVFADFGDHVVAYEPSGRRIGTFPLGGEGGELSGSGGLAADSATGNVLVADSEGSRQVRLFGPKLAAEPVVTRESTRTVDVNEATIEGIVIPEGAQTSIRIDYGPTEAYGRSSDLVPVGSGFSPRTGIASLTGLESETTYHWRLVAVNAVGAVEGPDRTFATFPHSPPEPACPNEAIREAQHATYLPECRAYELVTPTEKGSAVVKNASSSVSGNSAVLGGNPPLPNSLSGLGGYKVERSEAGWFHSADLLPPASEAVFGPAAPEILLTPTQDAAVISLGANARLTPNGPSPEPSSLPPVKFRTNYVWHEGLPLNVIQTRPTDTELNELVSQGRSFIPRVLGASADLSRIVFDAPGTLAPGGASVATAGSNVYEWHEGTISALGILPGGAPAQGSGVGASAESDFAGAAHYGNEVLNAVSFGDNTSRVYFNAPVGLAQGEPKGQLYLRVNGVETVEISKSQASQPDPHGGPFPAVFQFASPGGGSVIFTSAGSLTTDANTGTDPIVGGGSGRANLYRYEVSTGRLTDLTVASGPQNEAAGAAVDEVVAASTDGSVIYFLASGVLDPGHGSSGGTNLYVYHDGHVDFVANGVPAEFGKYSASPSGDYLAIQSGSRLTGYDNASTSGVSKQEVYVYSLASKRLDCASCPGGSPIVSGTLPSQNGPGLLVEPVSKRGLMTDDGTVMFESEEGLVAGANNGHVKAYAWRNGKRWKISGGASEGEDEVLGESSGTGDIFFRTYQQLLPADHDNALDVYDARVDGGFEGAARPIECTLGSCRSEGGSMESGTDGTGNRFAGSGFDGPPCLKLNRQAKKVRGQSRRARKHGAKKRANRLQKRSRQLQREAKACTRAGGAR